MKTPSPDGSRWLIAGPKIVGRRNVGQFAFAGAIAYFLFREVPSTTFYAASALVVGGIALVVFAPSASRAPNSADQKRETMRDYRESGREGLVTAG